MNPTTSGPIHVLLLGHDDRIETMLKATSNLSYRVLDALSRVPENDLSNELDLVLLDRTVESSFGPEEHGDIREQLPNRPMIILDDSENEEVAQLAMEKGVQDYLLKPELNREFLARSIRYALERWQLSQELQQQREQLKKSNKALQQFAYVISHDLQEPLRMITGYLELLEEHFGDELPEKAITYIEQAVDGGRRMKSMISDLLSYSRVKTQGSDFQTVDTGEVLDELLSDFQRVIESAGAEIEYDQLTTVYGDRGQIRHLFQNFLDNAIKFSGDEDPRIKISADRVGDRWEFHVTDNGIGIDPINQDEIFMIFRRINKKDYEGTGLGLALCKQIVDRHSGEIRVESDGTSGTTFHFTLPEAKYP